MEAMFQKSAVQGESDHVTWNPIPMLRSLKSIVIVFPMPIPTITNEPFTSKKTQTG